MVIDIITIFPDVFNKVFDYGVIAQGVKNNLIKTNVINLRDYSNYSHKQVDDRPYGGGPGMILMVEPLYKAITALKTDKSKVIYLSPKGKTLNQELSETLSKLEHLIIICGRYEGIDQRIIDNFIDMEISIGDYILSGGEFAAMVLVDSVARLVTGVIKNDEFNNSESFSSPSDRTLLDFPQYTRPENYQNLKVPEVLLSGNHKDIDNWRNKNKLAK